MHLVKAASGAVLALALAACSATDEDGGGVTTEMLLGAASDNSEWLTYGRDYSEQRYSPLDQINLETVSDLGLAWHADMDTARGQEATPLVIDGKIYVTTAWSKVKAYNAVTGEPLWDFDPQVPGETAVKACCDVVNRGLAAYGDKLYLGTLDGRLIALDRETGTEVWSKVTVDQSKPYTITGAPRVVAGKVIIGNGGAEYGVRGYVTAYDADSGDQAWRFYVVPGGPEEEGTEPEYLAKARETWNGEWWKLGGGGTVWDSMAYDPELDLLYIGTGNGSPWNQAYRSPGGGDNLYLSSIVAIRPETGEYVWHYQETPGETWDFTATQHIMLADLEIDGRTRKVLMQAPKNGFFYVLDRETGELISADNYVPQELDHRHRHGHRPADRGARGALWRHRQAVRVHPRRGRRTFVASDGLQSHTGAGLYPGHRSRVPLFPRSQLEARPQARLQRGCRSGCRGHARHRGRCAKALRQAQKVR